MGRELEVNAFKCDIPASEYCCIL